MSTARRQISILVISLAGALTIICTAISLVSVDFSNALIEVPGRSAREFLPPIRVRANWDQLIIRSKFDFNPWQASRLELRADNCIAGVSLNGTRIYAPSSSYCDEHFPLELDLSPQLNLGKNDLAVEIENHGGYGGLHLESSRLSHQVLILYCTMLLSLIWFSINLAKILRLTTNDALFYSTLILGILARLVYYYSTPYWVRAHDIWGHTDYVRHVATEFSVPHAERGWEFFQPPLYYFIAGSWMKLNLFFDRSPISIFGDLGFASLLLSIITLVLAIGTGRELLAKETPRLAIISYGLIIALLPGLIYYASPVTNEALYHTLTFGAIYVLSRYRHNSRSWYLAVLIIGAATITKTTAITLLPILAISLLTDSALALKSRFKMAVVGSLLLLAVTGWYLVLRLARDGQTTLVGNIDRLGRDYAVSNSLTDFFSFNTRAMLQYPFNLVLGDSRPRGHLLEFLFRSIFFGEYDFGPRFWAIACSILMFGFCLLPFFVYGLARDLISRQRSILVLATFLCTFGSLVCYRYLHPFSVNQDFRFIHVLSIPIAFYVSRGIADSRGIGKLLALIFMIGMSFSCLSLIGKIFLTLN